MSLTTPFSVQKLQTALHAKAKESPNFRFHALYDKVYRKDILAYAYERCKANGGAAGVDNQTFENIEAYGKERWLDELAQELKSRTYQPLPVRRVYIPKPDGKQRPLGIPTEKSNLSTTSCAAGLHTQAGWEAETVRHTDGGFIMHPLQSRFRMSAEFGVSCVPSLAISAHRLP